MKENKLLTENPLYKYQKLTGITIRDLSQITGMGVTQLYNIRAGRGQPRLTTIRLLCRSTKGKITLEDFIEYENRFNIHRPYTNPLGSPLRVRKEKLGQEICPEARVQKTD